jgi:retron-type reverse transcriptase
MGIRSARRLAQLLEIPLARLREIADEISNDPDSHYKYHSELKPGSSKPRHYMVPRPELRSIQDKISSRVLSKFPLCDTAHGGVRGKSPRTNAAQHLGKPYLVNMDVKSFFPNVRHYVVYNTFQRELQCGREVASLLTRLTTVKAQLPQGAPTSTAIGNLIVTRAVDFPISKLTLQSGSTTTRFVDDIAISGDRPQAFIDATCRALSRKRLPIWRKSAKFRPKQKFKITPNWQRQEVTGLVVNAKHGPSVPRDYRERVRAAIFQLSDLDDATARHKAELSIQGKIAYIKSCNPGSAKRLQRYLQRLTGK